MIHPKEIIQRIEQRHNIVIPLDVEEDIMTMLDIYRNQIIRECQDALSHHYQPMIYKNGYPINAVPQAIVLSLPHLIVK